MTKIWKTKIKTVTKTKDIGYISKKLKMKYARHNIIRNQEDRWEQRTFVWTAHGKKCRRGGRKTRCEEEIIKFCRIAWGRDA